MRGDVSDEMILHADRGCSTRPSGSRGSPASTTWPAQLAAQRYAWRVGDLRRSVVRGAVHFSIRFVGVENPALVQLLTVLRYATRSVRLSGSAILKLFSPPMFHTPEPPSRATTTMGKIQ